MLRRDRILIRDGACADPHSVRDGAGAGADEGGLTRDSISQLLPPQHREFLDEVLARYGVPIARSTLCGWVEAMHDVCAQTVGVGRFVLVSAKQAQSPTSTNAAYGAAKAAAEAWTLAYADELTETRGTANILVVNAIVTDEMCAANPDQAYRTFADARHMADAIALLLSDSAAAMNGQRLSLHG